MSEPLSPEKQAAKDMGEIFERYGPELRQAFEKAMAEHDAAAQAEIARLREALEPFAAVADRIDARGKELRVVISEHASWPSSAGAYWRARTALARLGELGDE